MILALPALAKEQFRIRLINEVGGQIKISQDGGKNWQKVGQVKIPASKLSLAGFEASSYGKKGRVVATAVNALHIKVKQEGEKPVLFSILPEETMEKGFNPLSYFSASSSIFTDIPAGKGIFGEEFSPYVGSQVFLGEKMEPLGPDYIPKIGDLLTILADRPTPYPTQMIFENKKDGKVTVKYLNGQTQDIAKVLSPVVGTGRFTGSLYTDVGRIRANHPGVICISTSPLGQIGGFQIVPSIHSAKIGTLGKEQWLTVGPLNDKEGIEGKIPLFFQYLKPYYTGNWKKDFLVDVRINNGPWQPMPRIVGLHPRDLGNVTHIRILFPLN